MDLPRTQRAEVKFIALKAAATALAKWKTVESFRNGYPKY